MEPTFLGNGRFEVLRRLGQGAMGVVYEAIDRNTAERVALKTLRVHTPGELLRLKTEFRALADLSHPNLVQLHELFSEEQRWFFTMDVVSGLPFTRWVRGTDDEEVLAPLPTWTPDQRDQLPRATPHRGLDPDGVLRLRQALPGLVAGVLALHSAGKLHRDIKPSNTLVREGGQTMLLDFGLISATQQVGSPSMAGTVPYMAPEVSAGTGASAATDWYAVGVMLFVCLTGRLPFMGNATQVLQDKQRREAPAVATVAPDVPADLARLTDALLARAPEARPDGAAVAEALGLERPERPLPFVGRHAELAALATAAAAAGQTVVTVTAPSGTGKTALLDTFLREQKNATVLRARCYEREQAPFKALDPLMDALSVILEAAPPSTRSAVLPERAGALGRLFPVLTRLGRSFRLQEERQGLALREQAEQELVTLMTRVARSRRLIVVVDDLQWGDRDSATLLAALMRNGVPACWVFTWRDDDPAAAPLIAMLPLEEATAISLTPLPPPDAQRLAREVVTDPAVAQRLAAESEGHPYLLVELARWAAGHGGEHTDLDAVLDGRVAELREADQALLQVVAVAGHPLTSQVAVTAARSLHAAAGASSLALLRARHLVSSHEGRLTCAHDRLRERIRDVLGPADRAMVHRVLAEALPREAVANLAEHWLGAGEPARAARFALEAAQQAQAALAFDQAAHWYGVWLQIEGEHAERPRWQARRAEALAHAGRHREAGEAWLALSRGEGPQALTRRRLGLGHLLVAGELDRAYAELPGLLDALQLAMPHEGLLGMVELLYNTVRMRLFGPPRARPQTQLDLVRTDLLLALAESLILTDPMRGLVLQGRAIRAAYRSGDPKRLTPVLALRAVTESSLGRPAQAQALLEQAAALAEDDEGRDAVTLWRAAILTYDARYADALAVLESPAAASRAGDSPHQILWRTFALLCLSQLGRTRAFATEKTRAADDARARGQRIAEMMYRAGFPIVLGMANDEPDAALAELHRASAAWPEAHGSVPWVFQQCAWAQVELYQGQVDAALERVLAAEPIARSNGALLGPAQHAWWHAVGAVTALHAHHRHGGRALARRIDHHIRALLRRPDRVNQVTGLTHAVARAHQQGRTARAHRLLTRLETLAAGAQHGWWPHYIRGLRGCVTHCREDTDAAHQALAAMGVVDPLRFERVFWFVPGEPG